jgi:hypothetical protein
MLTTMPSDTFRSKDLVRQSKCRKKGYWPVQVFQIRFNVVCHRWAGFIKDYDGGTLMECYIHPAMDYLNINDLVAKQRAFIYRVCRLFCGNFDISIKRRGCRFSKKGQIPQLYIRVLKYSEPARGYRVLWTLRECMKVINFVDSLLCKGHYEHTRHFSWMDAAARFQRVHGAR